MNENLLFSIVTVCYNAEKTIPKTIDSVLSQKWMDMEYIIVDGASTDATIEIITNYSKRDSRVRCYSESDGGIYNAMNKGIRYSHGKFIYFLNAGDEFHDDKVLDKIAKAIINSQADIIIGNIGLKADAGLKEICYRVDERLQESLQKGSPICHQAIFASVSCLQEGFDECFKICADYDWLCRQINNQKKIVKAEVLITDYDIHGVSNQVSYQKYLWNEVFEAVRKNFPGLNMKELARFQDVFIKEKKRYFLYEFMNRWVILKQRRVDISSFFVQQDIFEIAIYGMHYMGQRLLDELEGSAVKVKYVVDQKASVQEGKNIVRCPSELDPIEAIVITPIFDYIEIKKGILRKLDCKVFSIEDVLYHEY